MTTQEILEAHTVKRPWSEASRMKCKCGEAVTAETEDQLYALHRAHVAEVLEKHMQAGARQAQVNVLNCVAIAWEGMAALRARHIYARMLRETANLIGDEPDGR